MEFITFEIAKKLKDLGYNTPFFFFYRIDDQLIHHAMVSKPLVYGENVDNEVVLAPTISQVLKWLREEKELHIEIRMYHNCYLWEIYNTKIYDVDLLYQKSEKYSTTEHETYEEAALAGINYVLDYLI